MTLTVTLLLPREECSTQVKNNTVSLTAPLFATTVFLLIGISKRLVKFIADSSDNIILYAAILELFVFAIPAAFFLKAKEKNFFEHSKVKVFSFSELPFVLTGGTTFAFGSVIILFLQKILFDFSDEATTILTGSDVSAIGVFLYYIIVPALCEELFFRSILISEYSSYGGPIAISISALFFAMLHFSFTEFPFYFFTGIVLGLITYVTGSSIPAIIIHILNNTVMVFFGDALTSFLMESATSIILAFLLVVLFLGSLVLFLSTMEELYEKRGIMYDKGYLPGKRKELLLGSAKAGIIEKKSKTLQTKSNAFLSPTLFLAIVIFILITLNVI